MLATASFHKDRRTVSLCSPALLTLQQHKLLHVHSFGKPFARRMDKKKKKTKKKKPGV